MEKLICRILVVCLLVGIVGFAGCKKDEPVEPTVTEVPAEPAAVVAEPAESGSEAVEKVVVKPEKLSDAEIMAKAIEMLESGTGQTKCPVMGGNIDKNIFVTYKGKKVYFCCKACVAKFEADPEAYVGKLPQFLIK